MLFKRDNHKIEKNFMTVDDALFICMSLGAAYNLGEKRLRGKAKRRLLKFCFFNKDLCELAADKYKTMTDDARSEFFSSYQLSEEFSKEIKLE